MKRRSRSALLLLALVAVIMATQAMCAQNRPDFSGTWKLSGTRSVPVRLGTVTLRIQHHGSGLTVQTDALQSTGTAHHATQSYTLDGKVSTSIGADGDEFRTSVVWKDQGLIFSVEEHEEGRVILSTEIWKLIVKVASLERVREGVPGGTGKQTLIYVRQSVNTTIEQ